MTHLHLNADAKQDSVVIILFLSYFTQANPRWFYTSMTVIFKVNMLIRALHLVKISHVF